MTKRIEALFDSGSVCDAKRLLSRTDSMFKMSRVMNGDVHSSAIPTQSVMDMGAVCEARSSVYDVCLFAVYFPGVTLRKVI